MSTETMQQNAPENQPSNFVPELDHKLSVRVPLDTIEVFERIRIKLYRMMPEHGMPTNAMIIIWLIYHAAESLFAESSSDGGVSPSS